MEQQIGLVADGKAQKEAVVAHTLEQFRAKFMFFVGHITRMDALFEASFSPLSSSGEKLHNGCTILIEFAIMSRTCCLRHPSAHSYPAVSVGGFCCFLLDV